MYPYAQPFLKWVGGKRQLVPELLKHISETWDHEQHLYVEPFLGGGALFFALQPKYAIVGDSNTQLINVYHVLQEKHTAAEMYKILDQWIPPYQYDPEGFFYEVRDNCDRADIGNELLAAARFIFINKTGFNGLYRVNKKGECNTPWGHNPKANFYDIEQLQQCASILNDDDGGAISINSDHFLDLLDEDTNVKGALIYFDPPYLPVTPTANFTGYTKDGFTYTDQIQLLNLAIDLRKQGAHILVSQGSGPHGDLLVRQYERCGFKIHPVQARRAINRDGSKRGAVGEYIISSV